MLPGTEEAPAVVAAQEQYLGKVEDGRKDRPGERVQKRSEDYDSRA